MDNGFADNLKLLQHYPIDIEVAAIIRLAVTLQQQDAAMLRGGDGGSAESTTPQSAPATTAGGRPATSFRMFLEKGSGVLSTLLQK